MAGSNEAVNPFARRQQQRTLWLIVSGSILLLIIAVSLIFYRESQKSGLIIRETSEQAVIKVNGRTVKGLSQSGGVFLPLSTGQYRIEITKPGSQPFIQDITTKKGEIQTLRPAYTLVASQSVSSASNLDYVRLSPDRKSVYYLGDNRTKLYRLEISNQVPIPLTDQPLSSILDVQWSSNPNVALILRPDGTYLHEIPRFDFTTQKYDRVADESIVSPVWDPNNPERIALAISSDGGEHSIALANKRFTDIQRLIFTENIPEPRVQWSPNSAYLLITGRGGNTSLNNLYMLDLESTALIRLTENGGVGEAHISQDGSKIMYDVTTSSGISRKIYSPSTQKTVDAGSGSVKTVTWRDNVTFYEVGSDGRSIVKRDISGASEALNISLPGTEPVRELIYAEGPASLVIRTDAGVYLVNVED